jgi:Trypsin-like peptidase domain
METDNLCGTVEPPNLPEIKDENRGTRSMRTKIKSLSAFVALSGALVTMLFALPNAQSKGNAHSKPQVAVPSIVSTSGGNAGMHTRADTLLPSVRYGTRIDLSQPSVTLDRLDIRSVTLSAPNQIGVNRSVAVSPKTRAQKFANPDGSQTIVLIIKSSGASGIGVHFRNFELSRGEQVYVYGPAADGIVSGPYTNNGPWGSGEFWSGTMVGDTAVIEFYTRTDNKGEGFEIFEVSHIFPELDWRLRFGEPDVLGCELDASCYGDLERDAVGRFVYQNNGTFVCTGTLLNDRAQDFTPYFLTANHCVPTQAVAQTVEVYWFYETTSCNSGVLRSDWIHSPPGANLLATGNSNDFSLLRLQNNAPGGAVFSGWEPNAQSTGTSVFALHHPGGSVPPDIDSYLRRSVGTITTTNAGCFALVNGYRTDWTSGTTEPGSSGSGLWNSSHHLVGVLGCGPSPATCSSPWALYSQFADFYSQIQPYIDPTGNLGNVSTRAFVQTGDNVMIGGFIVQGSAPKRVIVRAIGPDLSQYGVPNALADPTLELHDGTGALIASSDNWQTTIIGGIITADQVADIQNSGHGPGDPRESAIIANLSPGNYTAIVRGVNNTTGIALVEVYDLDASNASILGNISTRSFVQTGDNVMIGGFIVRGTAPERVIVRAIGPELSQYGVPNPLADPTLELHDGTGALIASNDDWQHTIIGGIITADQVADIQNSGHAPGDPRESAIIANLLPGNYTAILRGVSNTTGAALVEVYDLQ